MDIKTEESMKIKLYPHEVVPGCAWESEVTWYLGISTKKENFWLISYHVISLIVGVLFSSVLIFFIVNNGKGIIEYIGNIGREKLSMSICLYIIWLICSLVELYTYIDEYEFSERNCRTWGRLETAIRLAVRLVRGLPIVILAIGVATGIGYGIFYLSSLLINLL